MSYITACRLVQTHCIVIAAMLMESTCLVRHENAKKGKEQTETLKRVLLLMGARTYLSLSGVSCLCTMPSRANRRQGSKPRKHPHQRRSKSRVLRFIPPEGATAGPTRGKQTTQNKNKKTKRTTPHIFLKKKGGPASQPTGSAKLKS